MLTNVTAITFRKPRIGNHKAFFYINDKDVGIVSVKFILRVTQNLKTFFPLGFKQFCRALWTFSTTSCGVTVFFVSIPCENTLVLLAATNRAVIIKTFILMSFYFQIVVQSYCTIC